jgi:hypothetical protein
MTTGLTYSTYKSQIALLAVVAEDNAEFVSVLPQTITYAENRIYRDLDLLQTSAAVTGYFVNENSRTISIPQGTIVVLEQINVITPAGTVDPNAGTRNPLIATTKEYLDLVYGDSSGTGLPKYFAPFNDNLFYVGPFADAQYATEIVGTVRPNSLSASNTTTFISQYLPDLFIMASMVYISGFQRNFGRQSDDPQMAQSYEGQYQTLLKGALAEETRKKFESVAWSSQSASPFATPTR